MRHILLLLVLLLPALPVQASAQKVPPWICDSDAARAHMRFIVAKLVGIDERDITSIGTYAGGDYSGAFTGHETGSSKYGEPGEHDYRSDMHCVIQISTNGIPGVPRYAFLDERYNAMNGESANLEAISTLMNFDSHSTKWHMTSFAH